MTAIITHLIAVLIGGGAGWFGHKKYGATVAADAVKVANTLK
jgi:hypothetical protein